MVSGRLSPGTQGWLAGHQVNDTVVFPATGFIEVILRAGELAGCPVIDELVLHTALILSEQAPTDLQILVQPLDEHGRRAFSVHSRPGGQQSGAWTLHASGALSADQPAADPRSMPAPGVAGPRPGRLLRTAGPAGLPLQRSVPVAAGDRHRPGPARGRLRRGGVARRHRYHRLRHSPRPPGRRPAPVGLRVGPHRRGGLGDAAASVRVQRDHPVRHRGHPAACPPDPHRRGHASRCTPPTPPARR